MLNEVNLKLELPPPSLLLFTNDFLAMEAQLLLDYLFTNRFLFKLNQKKI